MLTNKTPIKSRVIVCPRYILLPSDPLGTTGNARIQLAEWEPSNHWGFAARSEFSALETLLLETFQKSNQSFESYLFVWIPHWTKKELFWRHENKSLLEVYNTSLIQIGLLGGQGKIGLNQCRVYMKERIIKLGKNRGRLANSYSPWFLEMTRYKLNKIKTKNSLQPTPALSVTFM